MCLSTYICWLTIIEQKANKQFVRATAVTRLMMQIYQYNKQNIIAGRYRNY